MSVIDASVVVEVVLRLPRAGAGQPHIFGAGATAAAPSLLDPEVLHVIRAFESGRQIDAEASRNALVALRDLPIERYPMLGLVERGWRLRRNFSAYDAMYVALAEALDTSLVTADRGLASAVNEHSRVKAILLK